MALTLLSKIPSDDSWPRGSSLSDDDTATTNSDNKYAAQANKIYAALGGADNVTSIDNCTTRLRLQVKDTGLIDRKQNQSHWRTWNENH